MGAFKKLIPSITNNYNTAFARSVVCQTDMDKLRLRATGSGHCFFFRLRWVRFMAANWAMGRIINNKEIALNTSRNNLLATVAYLKIHLENTREYVVQVGLWLVGMLARLLECWLRSNYKSIIDPFSENTGTDLIINNTFISYQLNLIKSLNKSRLATLQNNNNESFRLLA
jgi:hypothetical protein